MCTAWCSSTSTSTTRRSSRRSSSSRARPIRRPPASSCPSSVRSARHRHGALSRRAGRDRHRRPHRGIRQRAAAARGGRARRSEIDAHPVTNGQYLEFIAAGGYARPELWSEAGRPWLEESRARSAEVLVPECRRMDDTGHGPRGAGGTGPPGLSRVLVTRPRRSRGGRASGCRARSSGRRRHPGTRPPAAKRRYPWGDEPPTRELANLDQLGFGTAAVAAFPRNLSPIGCYGMIGDVWEWTSSDFGAWPGFESVPLPGVLRGLLRHRVQGASRGFVGHPPWCDAQHLPQLGLPHPPPDLQRLQVRRDD